jgi:F0F1-type ATP synthase gamma subunit
MKVEQVHELLKEIKGAFNRFEINEEMPRVWFKHLKDEKYEKVVSRLNKHIHTSRFEPTISDLLPSKEEREKAAQDHEIALVNWVNEGNDPRDFRPND